MNNSNDQAVGEQEGNLSLQSVYIFLHASLNLAFNPLPLSNRKNNVVLHL